MLSLGYAGSMAIRAPYKMHVVLAVLVPEARVHLLDVEPTSLVLGMTVVAGSARPLPVLQMAGEATQAFVHAHRRSIIA